jgi:L-fuculose-phosphate aldolase
MNIQQAKTEVISACKTITAHGLTVGTAGNISARASDDNVFVITPTSINYDTLTPEDLVVVDFKGEIVEGKYKPSVEVSMHQFIFNARMDVGAIVHTHSLYATALASCSKANGIPPYDIEIISYLGGYISIANFAPPGSKELARYTVDALGNNAAALMRNHGAVGVGTTMQNALTACEIVERSSQAVLFAQLLGGVDPIAGEFLLVAQEKSLMKRGIKS